MIITDIRGIRFPRCPKCGAEWGFFNGVSEYNGRLITVECSSLAGTGCGCSFFYNNYIGNVRDDNNVRHVLAVGIGNYTIQWIPNELCVVNSWGIDLAEQEVLLPNLPYDISLDKLKTYLLFS